MTEKTKYTVHKVKLLINLIAAPILVGLVAIAFGGPALLVARSWPALEAALSLPFLFMMVASFAVVFGGIQFVLFGGLAMYFFLRHHPPNIFYAALIGFVVNLTVTGIAIAFSNPGFDRGASTYLSLCLYYGSVFAPIWSAVTMWLYRKSITRPTSLNRLDKAAP